MPYLYPLLATCSALLVYLWTFAMCGQARQKYNIQAPAVTGAPEFERAYRVQMNTVEQLVLFLPSLWIFSIAVSSFWGGILGFVWAAGRMLYALSYAKDPSKRGPGFLIGLSTSAIMLLVGLGKLVWVAATGGGVG